MASESMSLEETNKVRISLGLAPLVEDDGGDGDAGGDVGDAGEEDADTIAESNWAQRRNEEKRLKEEKETKERLAKARNQRELRAKLQGKGLGEAETEGSGSGSASDWVKQSRKAAKARAIELEKLKAREKELEERDREALKYGEEDLAGLKVGHGLDDFQEGQDVILTLKDNKVLEDGDDELQNINLAEYARTAERLDLKKRGKTAYKYTGFDDDEFDAFTQGKDRGVLSKYDEVLGESSRSNEGFKLGESSSSTAAVAGGSSSSSRLALLQNEEEKQKAIRRELLSLDYTKTEQTDYLQEGEVGFKKPKKKKKRAGDKATSSSRRVGASTFDDGDDLAPSTSNGHGDVDMNGDHDDDEDKKPKIPTAERRLAKEGGKEMDGVIDDDDIQASLARQRRAANKKRVKIMKGEDLARQLLEEQEERNQRSSRAGSSMPVDASDANGEMLDVVKKEETEGDLISNGVQEEDEDDDDEHAGLVLDDTSEFIRNISARPVIAKREQAPSSSSSSRLPRVKSEPAEDGDVPLAEMDVKVEEVEEGEARDGGMDYDDDGDNEYDHRRLARETSTLSEGKPSRLSRSVEPEKKAEEDEAWASTATEKHHSSGLANTLALLKSSGEVKTLTPEEQERERAYKERERFMAEIKKAEMAAEAEKARNRATGSVKDQAQREYENKQRAFNLAQRQMEAFKHYKPNVEIAYTDEFGRDLTPKEAWKHLSHKFHGKGSGTNKREKLLKKIEDERKREAMSAGDTPLGTNAAFKARQERTGSATMILGVGNRNTAPSADTLLGSSAGKAALDVSKNKAGQGTSGTNKRKRTEPKVLG